MEVGSKLYCKVSRFFRMLAKIMIFIILVYVITAIYCTRDIRRIHTDFISQIKSLESDYINGTGFDVEKAKFLLENFEIKNDTNLDFQQTVENFLIELNSVEVLNCDSTEGIIVYELNGKPWNPADFTQRITNTFDFLVTTLSGYGYGWVYAYLIILFILLYIVVAINLIIEENNEAHHITNH